MFVLKAFVSVLTVSLMVEAVPVVFKESTPNGESIVAISSSDPNVERYLTQQFATRSGFTQLDAEEQNRPFNNLPQRPHSAVHSSYSIAVPGNAVAGAGRSFASASSGPFVPIFSLPIVPEGFGFNNFDVKDWVRNVESFYNPNFAGNSQVNSATAINDNGHIYGNVNAVTFDNREKGTNSFDNKPQNIGTFANIDKQAQTFDSRDENIPSYDNKANNGYDNKAKYKQY